MASVFSWVEMVGAKYFMPTLQNPKVLFILIILAAGGSIYTVRDMFFPDGITGEVGAVPTVDELPLIPDITVRLEKPQSVVLPKHDHKEYSLVGHSHQQKDWLPVIKEEVEKGADILDSKYHK